MGVRVLLYHRPIYYLFARSSTTSIRCDPYLPSSDGGVRRNSLLVDLAPQLDLIGLERRRGRTFGFRCELGWRF